MATGAVRGCPLDRPRTVSRTFGPARLRRMRRRTSGPIRRKSGPATRSTTRSRGSGRPGGVTAVSLRLLVDFCVSFFGLIETSSIMIVVEAKFSPTQRFALLAGGRAWTMLGSRKNSKPENYLKLPQDPTCPVHAVLGANTCTINITAIYKTPSTVFLHHHQHRKNSLSTNHTYLLHLPRIPSLQHQ